MRLICSILPKTNNLVETIGTRLSSLALLLSYILSFPPLINLEIDAFEVVKQHKPEPGFHAPTMNLLGKELDCDSA